MYMKATSLEIRKLGGNKVRITLAGCDTTLEIEFDTMGKLQMDLERICVTDLTAAPSPAKGALAVAQAT